MHPCRQQLAGNPGVPGAAAAPADCPAAVPAAAPAAASATRGENATAQDPFDPEIFNRRYARRAPHP